jgi:hypothetical protein
MLVDIFFHYMISYGKSLMERRWIMIIFISGFQGINFLPHSRVTMTLVIPPGRMGEGCPALVTRIRIGSIDPYSMMTVGQLHQGGG